MRLGQAVHRSCLTETPFSGPCKDPSSRKRSAAIKPKKQRKINKNSKRISKTYEYLGRESVAVKQMLTAAIKCVTPVHVKLQETVSAGSRTTADFFFNKKITKM
jgi:hypothetical protein